MERVDVEGAILEVMRVHQRMAAGIGRCGCGVPTADGWVHREHLASALTDLFFHIIGET